MKKQTFLEIIIYLLLVALVIIFLGRGLLRKVMRLRHSQVVINSIKQEMI